MFHLKDLRDIFKNSLGTIFICGFEPEGVWALIKANYSALIHCNEHVTQCKCSAHSYVLKFNFGPIWISPLTKKH